CFVRGADDRVNGRREGRGVGEVEALDLFRLESGVERRGVNVYAPGDALARGHLRAEQSARPVRDEPRLDLRRAGVVARARKCLRLRLRSVEARAARLLKRESGARDLKTKDFDDLRADYAGVA